MYQIGSVGRDASRPPPPPGDYTFTFYISTVSRMSALSSTVWGKSPRKLAMLKDTCKIIRKLLNESFIRIRIVSELSRAMILHIIITQGHPCTGLFAHGLPV
jgi:hypothetical protein